MRKIIIKFKINFYLNLFFHLERISGSVQQRFSKKYYKKFLEERDIANNFKWEFDPQTISWNFKKELVKIRSNNYIPSAFKNGATNFSNKIEQLFIKSMINYVPYWEKNAKIKLKNFEVRLKKIKPQIGQIAKKICKFTNIPFKKIIYVYLVESLSEEYGTGAEPINHGIAIGLVDDLGLLKRIVAHELVHLNIKNRVVNLIPLKYKKDEKKINEAITDIITNLILELNEKPHSKNNFYINLFWKYLKNAKIKNFEIFIKRLFEKTLNSS